MSASSPSAPSARTRELFTRLSAALRGARFYPANHSVLERLVGALQQTLDAFFAESADVSLTFSEGEILLGERVLAQESVLFDQLVRDLAQVGAESITFRRGLKEPELTRVIGVLATDPDTVRDGGGLASLAEKADLPNVGFACVTVYAPLGPIDPAVGLEPRSAARVSYDAGIDALRELARSLGNDGPVSVTGVRNVVQTLLDHVMGNRPAILELAGLKDHDEYTFYHSVNVAILALGMGSAITSDHRFLASLGAGALLHDVGKLQIELDVLNKSGALSAGEWELMREHPVWGAEIAARMPGLDRSAIVIIYEHHQRLDASGYPTSSRGHGQALASRIVSVADAYDAMTSVRSYSGARLPDEAMGVLTHAAGTSFDPVVVRLFVRLMGVYPPRSVVRLTSGELAVVTETDRDDPARPAVNAFADASGTLLAAPRRVRLASPDAAGIGVVGCVDVAGAGIDVEDYL
jgi:putative nucleotidyltransferase with HDIG domain